MKSLSADRVRRIRTGLGLTQGQLAKLVGVHPLTVSKWERGLLSPNAHQDALLRSFQKAEGQAELGETIGKLLVTAGVAAALYILLKAAEE
jgi:transcriptional regulator with XRE-family HTH domain